MAQVIPGLMLSTQSTGPLVILFGNGDPNSSSDTNVTGACQGSLYLRLDGSTSTTLYVKTATGNTWTAK